MRKLSDPLLLSNNLLLTVVTLSRLVVCAIDRTDSVSEQQPSTVWYNTAWTICNANASRSCKSERLLSIVAHKNHHQKKPEYLDRETFSLETIGTNYLISQKSESIKSSQHGRPGKSSTLSASKHAREQVICQG